MNHKSTFISILTHGYLFLWLPLIPLPVFAELEKAPRPNIIVIMADDMGWSDIGCYGGEIDTPNIDQLAAEGLRFTQFYNNGKCTTTRASLVTGLYPRNGGRGIRKLLTDQMVTIGEVLKTTGYRTALSGKWHLGSEPPNRPIDRGFDEYYGLMDGCCSYFNPAQRDPDFKGSRIRVFGHNDQIIKAPFAPDYYTTDAFTDHAIETIKQFAETGDPFLIHVSYTAPHYPLHAKPDDIAKYRGKYEIGWDELRRRRYEKLIEMGLIPSTWKIYPQDPRAYSWEAANQEWEDLRMATYAAMIDSMDGNIGRIMQALKDLGIDENTMILFFSDNGGCAEEPGGRDDTQPPGLAETYTAVGPSWGWAQNTPFRRYKATMYEGGVATPLIVRWPDVVGPNTITNEVGHVIDLMPTFLEIAGATYPAFHQGKWIIPLEGKSLSPILRGEKREGHDTLYWHFNGNRAIRQGKWKLVWDKSFKKWELYDLTADRTETTDLSEANPKIVKKLRTAYQTWAIRTDVEKAKFAKVQYKRVHQKALRQILSGDLELPIQTMKSFVDQNPTDVESRFILTLAYLQQREIENANANIKQAIELGMPIERFIAGPRGLFQTFANQPLYRELRQFHDGVVHGPMVGSVTHESARFWVRTSGEDELEIKVWAVNEPIRKQSVWTRANQDYTGVLEITGLRPDTEYQYNLSGFKGKFRTSPSPKSHTRFTIAFGGGAGYTPENERMWETIRSFNPQALLLLGDNIYSDDPQSTAMQQYCYYRRQSQEEYRRLLASTPVYAIWDDHDFCTNDKWGGPEIDNPPWKRTVWQTFGQNWVNPYYGGGEAQPGCWFDFEIGDVHFILLDGRYYRTDPKVETPSMLGPAQKAWLFETLKNSNATFKVLGSPVPWDFRTKGGSTDTWNGFREEREEIFRFIEQNRIEGIVLMSADRHRSDAWRIVRPNGYDFYEFNSSRLTNRHVHKTMDEAIFSYNEKQSFGIVEFDTMIENPSVTYKVVNIDGEVVCGLLVTRSQLTFGTKQTR